ncbi:MAG: hypothetical protein KIT83_19265 [Bryobacterales bacterium]|nr:hypothetical protein [Bryobacterales bacterium]
MTAVQAVSHLPVSSANLEARIANSALLQQGGFRVFPGLYGEEGLQLLRAEALQLYPGARESSTSVSDGEEVRGGDPARRFLSCAAGPVQDYYYQSPALIQFFREMIGLDVRPTGPRGTYTYYARPGDFLSVHRDVKACDLAVVTCLVDNGSHKAESGLMDFYPGRTREPLSAIRATLSSGRVSRRLMPGETVAMLGGVVPHAIRPVDAGGQRVVSVLCYEVA